MEKQVGAWWCMHNQRPGGFGQCKLYGVYMITRIRTGNTGLQETEDRVELTALRRH